MFYSLGLLTVNWTLTAGSPWLWQMTAKKILMVTGWPNLKRKTFMGQATRMLTLIMMGLAIVGRSNFSLILRIQILIKMGYSMESKLVPEPLLIRMTPEQIPFIETPMRMGLSTVSNQGQVFSYLQKILDPIQMF